MSRASIALSDSLGAYVLDHGVREDALLAELREMTGRRPDANMQIAPEQGAFMAMLTRLMNCQRAIEVGVFTGYSALCVARALPDDGILVACDISEEFTDIAKGYWERAGVASRIDLRIAPASETLQHLIDEGQGGSFDLAFIDADKGAYETYYELCLGLLRPGGVILVDNVLWSGSVTDADNTQADTVAIRAFNEARSRDDRVDISMIPVGDGLSLLRKR